MDNEYEFYKPGEYNAEDKKILEELQAEVDKVNNKGEINITDLVSGKLAGTPGIMDPEGRKVAIDEMMTMARRYGAHNPLFTDRDYAKKTKYGDLIAIQFVADPGAWPFVPKGKGIGDYMVVSDLNASLTFHRPVYEGDTLYSITDEQNWEDITPAAGSQYRTFALSGIGRAFNQKGELVAEGSKICKESFRRHKDPAKRFPNGAHAWESPLWWSRKPHIYTDKDWEYIISIWKNEKIRGSEVLYWDDVNIGDEPPPRAVGPVLTDVETDMMFDIPDWSTETKENVLAPKTFKKMVKNKQGIYVLPEYLEKKPSDAKSSTEAGGIPELSNRDWRAMIQNTVAAKWAAGMLYNWIGDEGWIQRIGWDIMAMPPGYPESVIPRYSKMPPLFDKFPYMEKVPFLRGCRAAWHAMEGDLVISRAYVFDKYEKDGEYFIDLAWWCKTIDEYLVEEGFATVKLPKKR